MFWFLKYFCRKKLRKKFAFLTQNKAKLCKNLIITLVFEKNANFFGENWQKSLIKCDHNIDPRWVCEKNRPNHLFLKINASSIFRKKKLNKNVGCFCNKKMLKVNNRSLGVHVNSPKLGSMLWSQFSAIFADFCVFLKNQCFDQIFAKSRSSLSKKRQYFRQIFRRKYLKNHSIGPWSPWSGIIPKIARCQ
jgi:hypothetical protein